MAFFDHPLLGRLIASPYSLFYEAVVEHPDGGLKVLVVHAEDDVQLIRALVDHADVHPGFAQGGEDLTGNTGPEGHFPANGGNYGDLSGSSSFWISARMVYRLEATASVGITTDTLSMPLGT